jgi:capsular polysaccharide biosynthesis protein
VVRLKDAVFVPGHACLYDLSGRRIDATVHLREGRPLRRVPPSIVPPSDLQRITDPVVYGGHLPKHFGHFLLESLSRTWIYVEQDLRGVPFVHSRTLFHLHEREMLEAALRPHRAPHVALSAPTLLSSVLVPEQGIELGRDYHPSMRGVYDTIRDELAGPLGAPDDTPVYFSRTHLPKDLRATLGETELEARLSSRGIRVVHPQELPLEEQIRTASQARTVIGLEGTALHLTLFRSQERAQTLSLSNRLPEINQFRVDRLRDAEHIHLHVQYPIHPRFPGVLGGRELAIGRYRSFLVPRLAERSIMRRLAS